MDKLLLKPSEVAQILGIGRSLTYELIAQGVIPHIRLGRCIRVSAQALQEWIKANEIGHVISSQASQANSGAMGGRAIASPPCERHER